MCFAISFSASRTRPRSEASTPRSASSEANAASANAEGESRGSSPCSRSMRSIAANTGEESRKSAIARRTTSCSPGSSERLAGSSAERRAGCSGGGGGGSPIRRGQGSGSPRTGSCMRRLASPGWRRGRPSARRPGGSSARRLVRIGLGARGGEGKALEAGGPGRVPNPDALDQRQGVLAPLLETGVAGGRVAQRAQLDDLRLEPLACALGVRRAHARLPLPVRETLLAPRIGVVVVAVLLPESRAIGGGQLQAADPPPALPEIAARHDQAQGPAGVGGELPALVSVGEQDVILHQLLEGQGRGESP